MTSKLPAFVYAAAPTQSCSFRTFFEPGAATNLLLLPGQLRPYGWDFTTNTLPKLVKGEYWESTSGERKALRLFRDGSLIARVSADSSFLGWGRDEELFRQKPRLNSVALVELAYNFAVLCQKLVTTVESPPAGLILGLGIRHAFIGGAKPIYVVPRILHSFGRLPDDPKYFAPESSMTKHLELKTQQVSSAPGTTAYLILTEIFSWFGVSANEIPYVRNDQNVKSVNAEAITQIQS